MAATDEENASTAEDGSSADAVEDEDEDVEEMDVTEMEIDNDWDSWWDVRTSHWDEL